MIRTEETRISTFPDNTISIINGICFSELCELVASWASRKDHSFTSEEVTAIATALQSDYDIQRGFDDNAERIAAAVLNSPALKQPKKNLRTFAVQYSERLTRTIYVKAEDDETARSLAEEYFSNNPLICEDFADSDMSSEQIEDMADEDCDVIS